MRKMLPVVLAFAIQVSPHSLFAQANVNLSNLSATSINADLVPGATNTRSFGSSAKAWRDLYLNNLLYMGGLRFLTFTTATSLQNTGVGVNSLAATSTGNNNTGVGAFSLRNNTTGFNNVAIGYGSQFTGSAGHNNVSIGALTLYKNTSGVSNAAIGNSALTNNTSGNNNMALGANALGSNTTGTANIGIGNRAMFTNKTSNYQVAVGDSALFNTNGTSGNVAVGSKALYSTTSGVDNTAVGYQALYGNTTGYQNIAFGGNALRANTTGIKNAAFGYYALYANTTGSGSTALGDFALYQNTTGSNNLAIGFSSLGSNTTGTNNTAAGFVTLQDNTTGSDNTSFGYAAGDYNTTGKQNTAVGSGALASNTTGNFNTAFGYQALNVCATVLDGENTAIGYRAQFKTTTGDGNTAIGSETLYSNTTGEVNTGIGISALYSVTTGYDNTGLGYGADVSDGSLYNVTALGYSAYATASDQVVLGNLDVMSVKAAVQLTTFSDGRFKKEIRENVPGLNFIKALRPVTYHYDIHGMNETMGIGKRKRLVNENSIGGKNTSSLNVNQNDQLEEKAIQRKEQKLYSGFVAQEVEKAAQMSNYDFSGLYKPQNDKDLYGLSYADFVVPLVKSVQQLSDSNTAKNAKIDSLTARLDQMAIQLQALTDLVKGRSGGGAVLSESSLLQNTPNPFRGSTTINYVLPHNSQRAKIMVSDMSGRVFQNISVNGSGPGYLTFNASSLAAGIYNYSLYVDEKIIETRQMVLAK